MKPEVGWDYFALDFDGWGTADFPIEALEAGHRDGMTLADFAEGIRAWIAEAVEGEEPSDDEAAVIAMVTEGTRPPEGHPMRDLCNQVLTEQDDMRPVFVRFMLSQHKSGVSLKDLAALAKKEKWCGDW